jgi:hypothetical protein
MLDYRLDRAVIQAYLKRMGTFLEALLEHLTRSIDAKDSGAIGEQVASLLHGKGSRYSLEPMKQGRYLIQLLEYHKDIIGTLRYLKSFPTSFSVKHNLSSKEYFRCYIENYLSEERMLRQRVEKCLARIGDECESSGVKNKHTLEKLESTISQFFKSGRNPPAYVTRYTEKNCKKYMEENNRSLERFVDQFFDEIRQVAFHDRIFR